MKLFSSEKDRPLTQILVDHKEEPLVLPMARSNTPPAHVVILFQDCLLYISSELRLIVVDCKNIAVFEHVIEQKIMSLSLNQNLLFVAALSQSNIRVSCNMLSKGGKISFDKEPFVLSAQMNGSANFHHALVAGDFDHLLLFCEGQTTQKPLTADRLFLI